MLIVPYTNTSDPLVLGKNLTQHQSIQCDIVDDTNILKPTLYLNYNANFLNFNYVQIPLFKRFYFVEQTVTYGGKIYFHCHVDVLESFKDEILSLNCLVSRQKNGQNFDIADSSIVTAKKRNYLEKNATPKNVFTGYQSSTRHCVISLMGKISRSSPLDGYAVFTYSVNNWNASWASCKIWYRQALHDITEFYTTQPNYSDVVSAWGANSIYIAV